MKNYEISFIVRPDLEKDAIEKLTKSYEKVLVNHKAKVLSSKELGQRELAYTIKNQKTGYYYLINVEANDAAIKEFDRLATLDENVLRHIIIKL
ncbi:MAG: 30S ribosomal protein S6 [Bacilli bacterium]|nr:30S ribosomal protein S6 [Bacilli bacterium]